MQRLQENKERAKLRNEKTHALRLIDRKFWITKIMIYLEVDDIIAMAPICTYFHLLVRSPLCTKHIIKIKSQTKITLSLNAFGKAAAPMTKEEPNKEDSDVKLEMLKNTKIFLTAQLTQY